MKIKKLKEKVWKANLELVRQGLVLYTWGNVLSLIHILLTLFNPARRVPIDTAAVPLKFLPVPLFGA